MLNVKSTSALAIISMAIAGGSLVSAQVGQNPGPLNAITSLPPASAGDPAPVAGSASNPALLISSGQVAVPEPENLADFVKDKGALLKLGKALFWDMQLGSDGIQSCASCHFKAGADNRSKNQISPGLLASKKDITFQLGGGPNYQLTAEDFPFHKLLDENDRSSPLISDINDITSSQGVFNSMLIKTVPGQPEDTIKYTPDEEGFEVGGINVRRVEPRNTPTVINTIYNKLQFWDGRAKETFNGVNIMGAADSSAFVYKAVKQNKLVEVPVVFNNAAIASLVTGPPQSVFELSSSGRDLPQIGRKFLSKAGKKLYNLNPLANQIVDPQDSVLGADSKSPRPGLHIPSYDNLIKQAFNQEWWKSNQIIQLNNDGTKTVLKQRAVGKILPEDQFELRQWNFSLFAGLAIQKYLSTLVSDETPFDKFQAGDISALTNQEIRGLALFVTSTDGNPKTGTPGTTGANCNTCHTIPEFTRASVRRTRGVASTDTDNPLVNNAANGFFANYGIRPAKDDPGAGDSTTSRFKAPTLRNIGLTAPYMHNGGKATLEQVVDFYNRGRGDDPGSPSAALLGLDAGEKADLVAFLRNGLTDQRVLYEKAPFDHPQLFIPNGHPGNQFNVASRGNTNGTQIATDQLMEIPAVGKNGVTAPQPNFLGLP